MLVSGRVPLKKKTVTNEGNIKSVSYRESRTKPTHLFGNEQLSQMSRFSSGIPSKNGSLHPGGDEPASWVGGGRSNLL